MLKRLLVIGAVIAASAVTVLVLLLWPHGSDQLTTPVSLPSVGADVFYVNAKAIVQRGPSRLVVVRLDRPAELIPHHYAHDGLDAPQTIESWSHLLHAPIVFNAGQFDQKLRHLGWLKANGHWIVEHRKEHWLGLLLSGPTDGGVWARIADLAEATPAVANHYRHVVQSMMLVDDGARVRVRDSDKSACRTVVGEDRRGRILIIVSEGAVILADLARFLPKAGLGIVRAMNLDGGIESQLDVNTPALQLVHYGQYGTGTTVFDEGPGQIRYPLPAVIAVRPVGSKS